MSALGKIFPIGVIVCAALAGIGWIVFTGGFGYFNTQILEITGHNSVPYYFTAVISPFLIILMIVAAVLLMVLSQMKVLHAVLGGIIIVLFMAVVVGAGAVAHELTRVITITNLSGGVAVELPAYFSAVIAGAIIELIFLGGALISLVLGYIFIENEDKN